MSFFKSIAIFFLLFHFINNSYCQSFDSNLNSFLPVEILDKSQMINMNYYNIFIGHPPFFLKLLNLDKNQSIKTLITSFLSFSSFFDIQKSFPNLKPLKTSIK